MKKSFIYAEDGAAGDGGAGGAGGGAPAPSPTLLSDGSPAPAGGAPAPTGDWKTELPESFRTNPTLQPFAGFETRAEMLDALGKSYDETKKMVGAKQILPPTDKSTPEQITAWRKTIGAPETPEGYGETLRPDSVPAEQWDGEAEKGFRALAHKHNLPVAAVKDIMSFYGQATKAGVDKFLAEEAAEITRGTEELRGEWKERFNDNKNVVIQFAGEFFGLKPNDPIFTRPDVVKGFYQAAKRAMGESKFVAGGNISVAGSNKSRANAVMNKANPADPLTRAYHGELGRVEQDEALAQVSSWLKD